MREIKFRAWDKIVSKMRTVAGIDLFVPRVVFSYKEGVDDFIPKERMLEDCILMQYTGLKDKNGKEIYEGDVVEYQYFNTSEQEIRKSEVKLMSIGDVNRNIEAYYPFCYSISGSYKEKEREITECYLTPSNDCEIIGNIYENPELLSSN